MAASRFLKDYGCDALWFKHARTGADWVHVPRPADSNNVFMVGFQTDVADSTGVPHILEHTALCGSTLYPVRDPFFKMLNRSMATFMNAMTFDDMTIYPFSSENKADYYNLLGVYLDAVFAPRLARLDFLQEGWRLEHENPRDTSSPIAFKGVVYNEMKGALADTNSLFQIRNQQALYANSPYAHVSGGDPDFITDLTHEQLVAFHAKNYHPSNARFYSYGSFALDEQMARVDAKLASFSPIQRNVLDDLPPRWSEPRSVHTTGPLDPLGDPAKQARLSVSYLTNLEKDVFASFAMRILTSLLTDGAASPMYKALIESGLGSDYASTTGYNQYANRTSVSFGIQGMDASKFDVATESIRDVLEDASRSGFSSDRIGALFHQIELELKHRTASFGMNLGWTTIRNMIHGGNPLDAMDTAKGLERLRTELRQPGFLENLVERELIANPHRLTFTMVPDPAYPDALARSEARRLESHVAALDDARREQIANDGRELLRIQETKEDLSCLPCLPLSAVNKEPTFFPVTSTLLPSGIKQHWRETPTNGVSYTYVKWDVSHLSDEDKLLLPLLCSALTSLGTKNKTLAQLDEAIRATTGGISASVYTSPSTTGTDPRDVLLVSASALDAQLAPMYSLVFEILRDTDWTATDNLATCLAALASGLATSVPDSGHVFAMRAAAAGLARSALSSELLSGMTQVEFLDKLVQGGDGPAALAERLKGLAARIRIARPEIMVVSGPEAVEAHERLHGEYEAEFSVTPAGAAHQLARMEPISPSHELRNYPMDLGVNYTARAFTGVPYTHHRDAASLKILASLLTTHYLHRELREKGGAYGGGARYSALEGVFSFMSYRDPPRAQRTLATLDAAVEWALGVAGRVGVEELEQAKLEAFRAMDRPVDAAHEGLAWFQYGLDREILQAHRDELFKVTLQDVERVARMVLTQPSATCVIGETVTA
ncbi:Mitochondrial presequence protease [Polyrhizophydium stewartii]|uniref:Presequence protease, mitochondrial n=1 Tax=Polyrhizophydium stewartii TaxID=2732419 RepID=A0ABR4NF57_9FUNG